MLTATWSAAKVREVAVEKKTLSRRAARGPWVGLGARLERGAVFGDLGHGGVEAGLHLSSRYNVDNGTQFTRCKQITQTARNSPPGSGIPRLSPGYGAE